MRLVLDAKAKQVKEFSDTLRSTGVDTLVETTNDIYWGSGFSAEVTERTKQDFWLGQNKMGTILEEIRASLKKEKKQKKKNKKTEKTLEEESAHTNRATRSSHAKTKTLECSGEEGNSSSSDG